MIFLLTLLIIFFFFLCGYSLLNLFKFNFNSQIEKLSYSWGIGIGFVAMQMFFYSLLGIQWSRISLILPWAIVIIFSFWKNKPKFKFKKEKLDRLEKFFLVLIISLLLFTAIESVMRPVQAWDGWSNWLLRPKVFFLKNNLSMDYVKYTTDEYPLVIPLMSTFDYKTIGQINDRDVLLLFYVYYLVIACLFYAKSKELAGRKTALVFTFLLISSQNLIRHGGRFEAGQADLPLAYFILASACLLLNFLKSKNLKNLIIFNIFLALTALVKNDGIPIFIMGNLITIFYVIKSKKIIYASSLLPSILLFGAWNIYKIANNYPKNFIAGSGSFHINEFPAILSVMFRQFLNFQNWNLLWIVFIFSLVIFYKDIKKIFPLFLLLISQWFFYVLAFILSPYTRAVDHVSGIIDRLYIHLAPLALLITVALISFNIGKLKKYFKGFI
jgi:hypothetical protein